MTTTVDDDARRAFMERFFESIGTDGYHSTYYHDDAVVEFPQSGERFEGVENFRAWREQYPADVAFRTRRLTGSGDVWVGECWVSYDGGPEMMGFAVHELRGDRIARERIYVVEPWEAPEWRAPWRAATPAE